MVSRAGEGQRGGELERIDDCSSNRIDHQRVVVVQEVLRVLDVGAKVVLFLHAEAVCRADVLQQRILLGRWRAAVTSWNEVDELCKN